MEDTLRFVGLVHPQMRPGKDNFFGRLFWGRELICIWPAAAAEDSIFGVLIFAGFWLLSGWSINVWWLVGAARSQKLLEELKMHEAKNGFLLFSFSAETPRCVALS